MFTNRLLITAALLLTLTVSAFAKDVNSNAGTSAFPFLKINVSARSVGMGGAMTGLADDESSLYYNPAGIASFENESRYILGYHNMYVDMQSGFAGYIRPLDEKKTIGLYLSYLNYGSFIETDDVGNVLGEFSGGDLVLAGSFGYRYNHQFKFGATVKLIYEKISEYSATGAAVDLGAKYTSDRQRYGFGLSVLNLGAQLSSLGAEKDKLPLQFRGGGYLQPKGIDVVLSTDLSVPVDNDPVVALGAEYFNFKPLYLRLGWNSFGNNYQSENSDESWAGMSFGIGFDIKRMQISYAFTPAAELGDSHRITLTGGI